MQFITDPEDLNETLAGFNPDLIILDLSSGEVGGVQTLIRLQQRKLDIPLLALLAQNSPILPHVVELDIEDILFTPVRAEEIEARIDLAKQRLSAAQAYMRAASHVLRLSISMNLPTDLRLISPVANIFTRDLKPRGQATDEQVFHIRLTLSEVLTNAVEHGSLEIALDEKMKALTEGTYDKLIAERLADPVLSARLIFVSMDLEADEVSYTVQDQGKGFDVEKTLERLAEPNPSSPCGRGLFFLRRFMDEFRYSEGGRRLHLRKRLTLHPA